MLYRIATALLVVSTNALTCNDISSTFHSLECCDSQTPDAQLSTPCAKKPITRKDVSIGLRDEMDDDGNMVKVPRTYSMLVANEQGSGPAVLMVPGFPSSADMYRPVIDEFANKGDYRCYVIDLIGMAVGATPATGIVLGDTTPNATYPRGKYPIKDNRIVTVTNYRWTKFGADAALVMASIGETHYHVIGHDWGGPASQAVVDANPDAVLSVGLFNTFFGSAFNKPFGTEYDEYVKLLNGQPNTFNPTGQFAVSTSYMPQMCKGNAYAETAQSDSTNPGFVVPGITFTQLFNYNHENNKAFGEPNSVIQGAVARTRDLSRWSALMGYYRANVCGNDYDYPGSYLPNPAYDSQVNDALPSGGSYFGALLEFGEEKKAAYEYEVAQGWYKSDGTFDNGSPKYTMPLFMHRDPGDIYIQQDSIDAALASFVTTKYVVYPGDVYSDPVTQEAYNNASLTGNRHWITTQKAAHYFSEFDAWRKTLA